MKKLTKGSRRKVIGGALMAVALTVSQTGYGYGWGVACAGDSRLKANVVDQETGIKWGRACTG